MSDNLKRYCAIRAALNQLFGAITGRHSQHLVVLAAIISGIVGSRKVNLPAIASKVPSTSKRESQIKKYSRWIGNEHISHETYYLPFIRAVLASLPAGPLTLVMDASDVGRGCMALVISVVYQKRALPLCWRVVEGKKGHLPQEVHVQLLREMMPLIPSERQIVFLGDGEFDGVGLLQAITDQGWQYVCRMAKNIKVCERFEDAPYRYSLSWLPLEPGDLIELPDVRITERDYGPVTIVAVWGHGYREPFYLLTNMELPEEAAWYYQRRFRIETFFSDQKSRGFYLAHSHLSDPERLGRLMIASCLAYIWIVFLGAMVLAQGKVGVIHRKHRCDLSLFQIGMAWLEHCLNQGLQITVTWYAPRILAC